MFPVASRCKRHTQFDLVFPSWQGHFSRSNATEQNRLTLKLRIRRFEVRIFTGALFCLEILLSAGRAALLFSHGRTRLYRQRHRGGLQLLHSWPGAIGSGPAPDCDRSVLSRCRPLVRAPRLDHPPLVDSRCGALQRPCLTADSIKVVFPSKGVTASLRPLARFAFRLLTSAI